MFNNKTIEIMPGVEVIRERAKFPEKLESVFKEAGIATFSERSSKGKQLITMFSDAIVIYSFDFDGKLLKVEK